MQDGVGGEVVLINQRAPERETGDIALLRFASARERRKTACEQGEKFLEKSFRARLCLRARVEVV